MKKVLKRTIPVIVILGVAALFLLYTGIYYHAEPAAEAALQTDETVTVTKTAYGWFFDGPSEDDLLVFYPGAKVEESAYAPLLHRLAGEGMDVCLVKMPFRLAFFGMNKAEHILSMYSHKNRYISGHSLGGAMAAGFAAGNSEKLDGVILFAAYPTKPVDNRLVMLSIYGSEDKVLNMEKFSEGRAYAPGNYHEYVIPGGNHAQFGNYGKQKGDGAGLISYEAQQALAVEYVVQNIRP